MMNNYIKLLQEQHGVKQSINKPCFRRSQLIVLITLCFNQFYPN